LNVADEQCHHRDAASSISTFLTSAVTDLLTTGKFILPTHYIFISFVVQHIIMLYNSWHFSFCTVSRRDTQQQQNTALWAMQALSVTVC